MRGQLAHILFMVILHTSSATIPCRKDKNDGKPYRELAVLVLLQLCQICDAWSRRLEMGDAEDFAVDIEDRCVVWVDGDVDLLLHMKCSISTDEEKLNITLGALHGKCDITVPLDPPSPYLYT